jgi:hypothetical protein
VSIPRQRRPTAVVRRWCSERGRPRSTGLGPTLPPPFRLDLTGVGDRTQPVELAGGVQLRQQQLVQPLPQPGPLPPTQPPPTRHPRAKTKLLRQMLPGDPRLQHEQDPAHTHRSSSGLRPGYRNRRGRAGSNGSTGSHNPSDTTHGDSRIGIPDQLDDGCRRLRPQPAGPFIPLGALTWSKGSRGGDAPAVGCPPGLEQRSVQSSGGGSD